jgi:hypothetical protein
VTTIPITTAAMTSATMIQIVALRAVREAMWITSSLDARLPRTVGSCGIPVARTRRGAATARALAKDQPIRAPAVVNCEIARHARDCLISHTSPPSLVRPCVGEPSRFG